jgi:cob(I)alamin adenosyltransferase
MLIFHNENYPMSDAHQKRMARKKQHIDQQIQHADEDRGIVVLITGNGKGKSSSGFGMVARSLGHQLSVAVIQFIKGQQDTGEDLFFRQLPQLDFYVMGSGFTWETQNKQADTEDAEKSWAKAQQYLSNPECDVLLLDELTYLINYGYLDEKQVIHDIMQRPKHQHVIVTGRAASDALINIADTVSEIKDVKHAFRKGIKAQKGIEL